MVPRLGLTDPNDVVSSAVSDPACDFCSHLLLVVFTFLDIAGMVARS